MHKSKWLFVIMVLFIAYTTIFNYGGCEYKRSPSGSGSSVSVPEEFNLISPCDGDTTTVNPSVFYPVPFFSVSWDNAVNAHSYLLEISKDDAFIPANSVYSCTLSSGITQYRVSEGVVLPNKWYYWRITALNPYGSAVASNAPFSFATGLKSSGTPSAGTFDLTEPLNISIDEALSSAPNAEILTPDFNWTNATNEVSYVVYLDNDNTFATALYTTSAKPGVLNAEIPDLVGLTETARYYWKVIAM